MDVFKLRNNIIQNYSRYIKSFIEIFDQKIAQKVQAELEKGLLWPDPLVQLNPAFESGAWINELVEDGILHQECKNIFRINKTRYGGGKELRLYKHQLEAIHAAKSGENYVLTTGTGSGKSLAYIIPIVDYVLRNGSGHGIRAIVVYPMNALANSQYGELEKFLCYGYPDGKGPVTFERYTGQEDEKTRERIITNPPDILLTNYVMLELILTRPRERKLIQAAHNLRFLVLDELHTYRGRQGADVAMLVRRVRNTCRATNLQCIGTSATLAGPGTFEEQQKQVASIASALFGDIVRPEMIIGESLSKVTRNIDIQQEHFVERLKESIEKAENFETEPDADYFAFIENPLSIWIEQNLGVKPDESGRLIRCNPRSIQGKNGLAEDLKQLTGLSSEKCTRAIKTQLLKGTQIKNPETGFPVFAFRLHQFVSKGDTVYASPEYEDERYITLYGQQYVPGNRQKILLPLVFCRECGQEYFCVWKIKDPETGQTYFKPRKPDDHLSENGEPGYLYIRKDLPWPEDQSQILSRLPDDWLEEHNGVYRILPSRKKYLPRQIKISPDGREAAQDAASQITAHFVSQPFRFCLRCAVSYGMRQDSDFAKLATLGTEGRSTATTILSLSIIQNLKQSKTFKPEAKKLLSFTDNRQDASLQAGHFNDFIQVGVLRSALYNALVKTGTNGLTHENITFEVFKNLNLTPEDYSVQPDAVFARKTNIDRALREVLGYRIYHDLRRGWRVTTPNLEQCGLLRIQYLDMDEICAAEELWAEHPLLKEASIEERKKIAQALLDFMRRSLAIKVDYLNKEYQEKLRQLSSSIL